MRVWHSGDDAQWQVPGNCLSIGDLPPIIGHFLPLPAGGCNDGSH